MYPTERLPCLSIDAFATLALCPSTNAGLSARPVKIKVADKLTNREKFQDIALKNIGQSTKQIEIIPMRIRTMDERPDNLCSPNDTDKPGLQIAPDRLELQPGEEKIMRVTQINEQPENGETWRAYIRLV